MLFFLTPIIKITCVDNREQFCSPCHTKRRLGWPGARQALRPVKGGLNVRCRLEILGNVWCRFGNESVGLKWGVECRTDNFECRCRPKLILVWMSVSDGKNGPVSEKPLSWSLALFFGMTATKILKKKELKTYFCMTQLKYYFCCTWGGGIHGPCAV